MKPYGQSLRRRLFVNSIHISQCHADFFYGGVGGDGLDDYFPNNSTNSSTDIPAASLEFSEAMARSKALFYTLKLVRERIWHRPIIRTIPDHRHRAAIYLHGKVRIYIGLHVTGALGYRRPQSQFSSL